ncbi:MAG: competence/damage-inducible protein A [Pseudanabaenaceae cyanobacterium SKYGB_i_bin29]|nr:competence/damage-inducible protein A [Pseudanabaenaceae cyanobacterium SKYG29]MDW8420766.1 competence/damage-inducible protein A [Pseudanabaenaceae cyanobacterium SKYGB_i_bin29]
MSSKTAEVICIGTELLLGEITNTNAQYLAQQLAKLGICHYYQTVVGDNVTRIQKALAIAAGRSNLIITTGGLGPTADDLTTQTIAQFFDTPLEERAEVWADIQAKFAGREIPSSNRKQALLPRGATVLPNPTGTAPGMIWEPKPGLVIMTFPGVPSELYPMWEETAVPWLQSHGWVSDPLWSRVLLYWGIGESALAEQVSDLLQLSQPTVAPYANYGQARLRITTRAKDQETALAIIQPIEQEILRRTGQYCYGFDDDTLELVVGRHLRAQGQTLAVAESCTGGWLGKMITSVPGCSDYFVGGVIAYSNQVKVEVLGVNKTDLEQHGAVSAVVAEQMAAGVKSKLGTDWGISITGIAGPGGGTPRKPVGLVYIGLATPTGKVESFEHRFSPSRDRNWLRQVSACSALNHLRERFVMMQNT